MQIQSLLVEVNEIDPGRKGTQLVYEYVYNVV